MTGPEEDPNPAVYDIEYDFEWMPEDEEGLEP